jgi:hypothetical protein
MLHRWEAAVFDQAPARPPPPPLPSPCMQVYIEQRAQELGLRNVTVITANMVNFQVGCGAGCVCGGGGGGRLSCVGLCGCGCG